MDSVIYIDRPGGKKIECRHMLWEMTDELEGKITKAHLLQVDLKIIVSCMTRTNPNVLLKVLDYTMKIAKF